MEREEAERKGRRREIEIDKKYIEEEKSEGRKRNKRK